MARMRFTSARMAGSAASRSGRPHATSIIETASTIAHRSITEILYRASRAGCDNDGGMRWGCAILTVLVMLTACSHRVRLGTAANLPAPALVAPRDQAVLTNHPRTVR